MYQRKPRESTSDYPIAIQPQRRLCKTHGFVCESRYLQVPFHESTITRQGNPLHAIILVNEITPEHLCHLWSPYPDVNRFSFTSRSGRSILLTVHRRHRRRFGTTVCQRKLSLILPHSLQI